MTAVGARLDPPNDDPVDRPAIEVDVEQVAVRARSRGRPGWPRRRRTSRPGSGRAGRSCPGASPRCSSASGRRRTAFRRRRPGRGRPGRTPSRRSRSCRSGRSRRARPSPNGRRRSTGYSRPGRGRVQAGAGVEAGRRVTRTAGRSPRSTASRGWRPASWSGRRSGRSPRRRSSRRRRATPRWSPGRIVNRNGLRDPKADDPAGVGVGAAGHRVGRQAGAGRRVDAEDRAVEDDRVAGRAAQALAAERAAARGRRRSGSRRHRTAGRRTGSWR